MPDAKNLAAIKKWTRENRPDCIEAIDRVANENPYILLMTICFEAGRTFQSELPEPSVYNGPVAYYD